MKAWVYKARYMRKTRIGRQLVAAHRQKYLFKGKNLRKFRPVDLSDAKSEEVVKKYTGKKMTNVKIHRQMIEGDYDGHHIKYPYFKVKHHPTIGVWSHNRNSKHITIDADVKPERVPGLLVHEAVEQYIAKKHGPEYRYSHKIATSAEEQYVKGKGGNWRAHQISVSKTPL